MITCTDLSLSIAGRPLLTDGAFTVGRGEKAALVGRNGTGKSSLISALVGTPAPQLSVHGDIACTGTVGFLPQVPVPGGLGADSAAFSHVISARSLDVLDTELSEARTHMAADPTNERIVRFSEAEERFRLAGGYEIEATIARMADGLGFAQELLFADVDSLSGGQRRRLDLMRVLFGTPDVMVLDEPTNHLDAPAKRWLMEQLERFSGALLLVSHDVRLLDRSISKVLHLDRGELTVYKGNYSTFRSERRLRIDQQQRLGVRQDREMARLSSLADSMRGSTEKRARLAKVLDARVERLKTTRVATVQHDRTVRFRLPTPPRSGDSALDTSCLAVSYGPLRVLTSVTMSLGRGDRAVVVGRNGAGKSSLLRCLAGVQEATRGTRTLGHHVVVGYFAQEHEQVDPDKSALDNVDTTVLVSERERRSLLGSFGLPGELATQRAGSLSGGERAKLSLAMLAAGWSNLLILDEPTNNLDPPSILAVGGMLARWPGTIVAVSHDRSFVEALRPTHALALPAERFDLWREELLDQVEQR